jgi:hypothetical protein
MAPDDPDLSNDDVPVDPELSPQRRARVEAERAKAEADFQSAFAVLDRASPDHVQEVEKLLAAYIHHVFFAFSQEALNQGFPAELIQIKTAGFLPLLVERTFFLKHPCARRGDRNAHWARFQQWAIWVVHNSPSWLQVEEALVKVAERDASKPAGAQSRPNLPREALIRIEQSEKDAREIYDRDKVPYFPMNPEFSFLETSIFRSISHIVDYVRLFAEAVLDSHLKEYLEYAPSDLLANEGLLRSLERDIWTLTDQLWNGYGQTLQCEPASRRARYGIAAAKGTIDQAPELEPWLYPDSQHWGAFIRRMAEPESEMARLNERYETAIKKAISDQIKRYQSEAASRIQKLPGPAAQLGGHDRDAGKNQQSTIGASSVTGTVQFTSDRDMPRGPVESTKLPGQLQPEATLHSNSNTADISRDCPNSSSGIPKPVLPRRTPDIQSSRDRINLITALATELAAIKQDLNGYCTVEILKKKHPHFVLWQHISDAEIIALIDGEPFKPRAWAENLTLKKFGLTSRETFKKDRRKLRKAERDGLI